MTKHLEAFEAMLTGGHPNSLGRTLEVVAAIEQQPQRLEELFGCYQSADAVVRLRTSNALKRITQAHPHWVVPYLDGLLTEVAALDQPSAQWTLATLFGLLRVHMSPQQHIRAKSHLQQLLQTHTDWIVLETSMQTLAEWAISDPYLAGWLLPQLRRLTQDPRPAVSRRAEKLLEQLS